MVLYIDTQDIDQYPGTVKRVAVDQDQIVPIGYEGDEQFVITVGTSSYSDNVARTAIQDIYVTNFVAGWCKSSGFAGSGGKFSLDSTHYIMKVKMDATASGSDGNGYYAIELDWDTSARSGALVAQDMEDKIRAIPDSDGWNIADAGFQLAYENASVEYKDGKFWIVSGSIGRYYTGSYRSSVKVASGSSNDCLATLGFNLPIDSQTIAGYTYPEAAVATTYTGNQAALLIEAGTGVAEGNALCITGDGVTFEYFTALAGTSDTSVAVAVSGVEGYTAISGTYTANAAKVQILRPQDPNARPTSWFNSVDELIRYGVKGIVNQIDYSS